MKGARAARPECVARAVELSACCPIAAHASRCPRRQVCQSNRAYNVLGTSLATQHARHAAWRTARLYAAAAANLARCNAGAPVYGADLLRLTEGLAHPCSRALNPERVAVTDRAWTGPSAASQAVWMAAMEAEARALLAGTGLTQQPPQPAGGAPLITELPDAPAAPETAAAPPAPVPAPPQQNGAAPADAVAALPNGAQPSSGGAMEVDAPPPASQQPAPAEAAAAAAAADGAAAGDDDASQAGAYGLRKRASNAPTASQLLAGEWSPAPEEHGAAAAALPSPTQAGGPSPAAAQRRRGEGRAAPAPAAGVLGLSGAALQGSLPWGGEAAGEEQGVAYR